MDDRSPEQRSKTMAAVKSQYTQVEKDFFLELESRGVNNTEQHPLDVIGKPDLVHRRAKVAVFLDGCFWHGCPQHLRMPATNKDYWERKIFRNRKRDLVVSRELLNAGWLVLRIWEHSLKNPRTKKWWCTRLINHINARSRSQEIAPVVP